MSKIQTIWPTLKRLLAYGSPYRKPLGLAVLMLWVAAAAEVAGPILIGYFIDNYVAKGQLPLVIVSSLAVAYILLELLAAALHYFQAILFNRVAVGVVQRLRTDVMDAALRQPLSAFDTQPVGQLISRVTNDTEVIEEFVCDGSVHGTEKCGADRGNAGGDVQPGLAHGAGGDSASSRRCWW